jgi:carotenoid cleavage dioxygenase
MSIINRRDENRRKLVMLEAQHMEDGPVAVIKTPVRLKYGIHGNWVPNLVWVKRSAIVIDVI